MSSMIRIGSACRSGTLAGIERQQLKWLLFAAAITVVILSLRGY
jgi:hypothetical protein